MLNFVVFMELRLTALSKYNPDDHKNYNGAQAATAQF